MDLTRHDVSVGVVVANLALLFLSVVKLLKLEQLIPLQILHNWNHQLCVHLLVSIKYRTMYMLFCYYK